MSATLFEMASQPEEQPQVVCLEEQLVVGMSSLELSESVVTPSNCDGSDSGLDVASCCHSRVTLQRGLSSTSGGYTSSNGLEEIYDSCELKVTTVPQAPSETGSEKTSPPRRTGSVKKKFLYRIHGAMVQIGMRLYQQSYIKTGTSGYQNCVIFTILKLKLL